MSKDKDDILKKRLISSQVASIAQILCYFFTNLITKFILARLLFPKDFGIFALVVLFFSGIDTIRELGIGNNIIRSKEEEYYGNAILINILSSFLWIALIFIFANFFSKLNPSLPAVIKVYVFLTLINSFSQLAGVYFRKNLLIAKMLFPRIISGAIYLAVAIILARNRLGVFSIIYAQIASGGFLAIFLWYIFIKNIKIKFTFKYTKELLKTSRYFLGLGFMVVILPQLDYGILGTTVSTAQIGYYFMALSLVALCYKYVTPLFCHYIFPLFSKLQDDKEKLYKYYKLTTITAMMMLVPICTFLFFKAEGLILLLYGDRWAAAIFILKALALWPIVTPYVLFGDDIINIKNENITFYSYLFYFVCFSVIGYILILKIGIIGCIIAKYISELLASLPRLYKIYGIFDKRPIFFKEYIVVYSVPFLTFAIFGGNIWMGVCALLTSYLIYFIVFRRKISRVYNALKESFSYSDINKDFVAYNA